MSTSPAAPSRRASAATASPLVAAEDLLRGRELGTVIVDCSFDLSNPSVGEQAYREARIPGARYWHLDRDLSATKLPDPATGRDPRGRHPMPARRDWAATVGAVGISPGTPVVVYDRQGGMFAGRAWWLLRWLGHAVVHVVDGGLPAWVAAGGAVASGDPVASATGAGHTSYPTDLAALVRMASAREVLDAMPHGAHPRRVLDARAAERFRGDVEPLDPVAGHIPGARNRPFQQNLQADGRFKPAEQLRAEWAVLLEGAPGGAEAVVHHCGSGITACHNLMAQAVAGFGEGVLYPGSWSEWVADPTRPVATGPA